MTEMLPGLWRARGRQVVILILRSFALAMLVVMTLTFSTYAQGRIQLCDEAANAVASPAPSTTPIQSYAKEVAPSEAWLMHARLVTPGLNARTLSSAADFLRLPQTQQLSLFQQSFAAAKISTSVRSLSPSQADKVLTFVKSFLESPSFSPQKSAERPASWLEIVDNKPTIFAKHPSTLHVGASGDTGGPVAEAQADKSYYKVLDPNGKPCAKAYDESRLGDDINKLPHAVGSVEPLTNYPDYRELVLIVASDGAYCSGTLIGGQGQTAYVLTAGHCVAAKSRVENHLAELDSNLAAGYRVLLPKQQSAEQFSPECINPDNTSCPFWTGKISTGWLYSDDKNVGAKYVEVPGTTGLPPSPDVALLSVSFGESLSLRFAEVMEVPQGFSAANTSASAFDSVPLTQAGFGFSDNDAAPGKLSIVHMRATQPMVPNRSFLKFVYQDQKSQWARSCNGDSGGPMFMGRPTLVTTTTPRKVIGLISAVSNGNGAKVCAETTNKHEWIQPVTADIISWLKRLIRIPAQ